MLSLDFYIYIFRLAWFYIIYIYKQTTPWNRNRHRVLVQNQQTRELIITHLQGNAKKNNLHPSNTPWPSGECKEPHPLPLTPSTLPDLEGEYKEPHPPPLKHSLTLRGVQKQKQKKCHPSNTPWPSGERKEPHPPPLKHSLTLREVQRTPLSTPSSGERKQPPTPTKTPQPTGSVRGGGGRKGP